MEMNNQFIQKNGLAISVIARDLLTLAEGDRMKTISNYETQLSCSRWTIQTAIQFLLNKKTFRIESYGPNGSFVYDLDRQLLFGFAGWNPLLGLLPVPSSIIHHALFTGIVDAIGRAELPINFAYMAPASKRFEMLDKEQCNFILTSRLAYRINAEKFSKMTEILEIIGAKYCTAYKLYTMHNDVESIEDGMRIGVYDAAIEQKYLTDLLCEGKNVKKVYANYQNCQIMLATGEIDVLIQRGDLSDAPIVASRSIPLSDLGDIENDITTPVILTNNDDYGIAALLRQNIDIGLISFVQSSVLSGQRRYSYF
jgi:hypothetical protein